MKTLIYFANHNILTRLVTALTGRFPRERVFHVLLQTIVPQLTGPPLLNVTVDGTANQSDTVTYFQGMMNGLKSEAYLSTTTLLLVILVTLTIDGALAMLNLSSTVICVRNCERRTTHCW
jgi:hypothetical protein